MPKSNAHKHIHIYKLRSKCSPPLAKTAWYSDQCMINSLEQRAQVIYGHIWMHLKVMVWSAGNSNLTFEYVQKVETFRRKQNYIETDNIFF